MRIAKFARASLFVVTSLNFLHAQVTKISIGTSQPLSTLAGIRQGAHPATEQDQPSRELTPHAVTRHADASGPGDITGFYSGLLFQPNGTSVPTFQWEMTLIEAASGSVSGETFISVLGTPYFAIESLTGQVADGIFTFQNGQILSQNQIPGSYWCIESGQLSVSGDGDLLSGPWQASGCSPGTISVSRIDGRLTGDPSAAPGNCACGDPIEVNTGNVFESFADYETSGQNKLMFTRYFNSRALNTASLELGTNWRSNFDRYLRLSPTSIVAERADGRQLTFTLSGTTWTTDTDVDVTLTASGTTWTLTDHNDTVETYTSANSGLALLDTIRARNGYTQKLVHNESNQLESVTDSYNRVLKFTYQTSGLLNTVTTPDTTTLTFGFASTNGGPNLISVTYSGSPAPVITYVYGNATLPNVLTGIIDENGDTYSTWSYDQFGRGLTSEHGMGADLTTVTYDDSDGSRTVTNALGVTDTYTFSSLQGVPKVSKITRARTATTAAAVETFTYDSNGYLASQTDWKSNKTSFVNNVHGQPKKIAEPLRSVSISYDPTFVHLPLQIVATGLTTSFTYDDTGNLLTRVLDDTTVATGLERTWTNTWSDSLVSSVKTPNGNFTKYAYDSSGALTSITDAASHTTTISSHTSGGLPETVVDSNGVTTTLAYSPRQLLTSKTLSGSGGKFTTLWTYDVAKNLTRVTLPDGSYLANMYDSAHRLISMTDEEGNFISYTLDPLGDRMQSAIFEKGGSTPVRKESGTYDALGRLLIHTAGAGQTTKFTYDPNSNVLSVTDGLGHETVATYDALNRKVTSTDANGGVTTTTYDTQDRIVAVKDANVNTTSYGRDGFGDVLQQTSPDSRKSVFHYDADGNQTQKLDALSVVTNHTYDKLDRILTTTYPAAAAENVTYTYDQTGTGFSFGIGRLTSVKDAAGSLTRAYDERGNLLSQKRVNGMTTLTTSYTYDPAGRIASTTYPDGTLVSNKYNAAGYLSSVSTKPSGASTTTTLATISHLPFGPIDAVAFGNGTAESWTFDLDYRPTGMIDARSGTNLQKLAYAYDSADNLKTINDAVNAANSQTLGYDVINRLTSAASGTGGYGDFSWTYDKVGNRLTQKLGSVTTDYGYTSGTNRLASIGSVKVTTNANGNITSIPPANGTALATFAYNKANRLSSVTGTTDAAAFVYDWAGLRFSKAHPSSTPILYTYSQDGSLIAENNGGKLTDYIYADGRPIADLQPSTTPAANEVNYILADHLGTPQLAVNSSGSTVWSTTYQPFGSAGSPISAIVQNLRLPGQDYDAETGFHYNSQRDYMPNMGRYLQEDRVGLKGGMNSYTYALNNPASLTDLFGAECISGSDSAEPTEPGASGEPPAGLPPGLPLPSNPGITGGEPTDGPTGIPITPPTEGGGGGSTPFRGRNPWTPVL